jgi:hypothetical protein
LNGMHVNAGGLIEFRATMQPASRVGCAASQIRACDSADDLQRAVGKVGNSIAAVSKELQTTAPVTEAVPIQIELPSRSKARVAMT